MRAVLAVTLREYADMQVEVRRIQTQPADHVKTRVLGPGESLSSVAGEEYGDPGRWREIARANGVDNPRTVQPGQVLVIPRLPEAGRGPG